MKRFTYEQIVEKYGKDVAGKLLGEMAEPTSTLINPAFGNPEHAGKHEWAGEPVRVGNETITAYYYLTDKDEENLDAFDWNSNVEFEVVEEW